jgi:uncharacterized protein YuzE
MLFPYHKPKSLGTYATSCKEAITKGSREPAKHGRKLCRYNFRFGKNWQGKHYPIKQVAPVIKEEPNEIVVLRSTRSPFRRHTTMKISYDSEIDALYIRLIEGKHECRTVRLNEEIALNIGKGEKLVGIEILDAKEVLGAGKLPSVVLEGLTASTAPQAVRVKYAKKYDT